MDGYSTFNNYDQDGQTIRKYPNNTQSQCKIDCDNNSNCRGIINFRSDCWTVKDFPKPYYRKDAITYKKNPRKDNIDGYNILTQQHQDGQTIKQYPIKTQLTQCISDCRLNESCAGLMFNGSNCSTVKGFPKTYSNTGSTIYKKKAPTVNFDDYTSIQGQGQNGKDIKQYTNNQQQCEADCNLDNNCVGMDINGSICSTLSGFNQYNNPGSTTYKKKIYPTPAVISSNFPTSANNNNIFSSVFCKNISSNNGFIQKANSTFNNLPVYKTQTASNENTCLNNCKKYGYCSSYKFIKNKTSSNCLLYNQVPTTVTGDISGNVGYKNGYKYDFNNLSTNQKNVIRNDCINNYLNKNNDTNNLNYTNTYTMGNNNSELNVNPQSLANMYEPLNKVKTRTNFTNIDNNLINSTTDKQLNNVANNFTGYLQTQIGIINTSNTAPSNNIYNESINIRTDIQSGDATNNLLEKKSDTSQSITQSINGTQNNINESFRNIGSSNIDKSNSINFYLFIFIVIIFLYIVYYLKKNKYFK
jgi:hypothetical protein